MAGAYLTVFCQRNKAQIDLKSWGAGLPGMKLRLAQAHCKTGDSHLRVTIQRSPVYMASPLPAFGPYPGSVSFTAFSYSWVDSAFGNLLSHIVLSVNLFHNFACACMRVCICVYVYMRACMCAYVCVYTDVRVCVPESNLKCHCSGIIIYLIFNVFLYLFIFILGV